MKITFAVARSGCAYWRAKQPCDMIRKQGLAEVEIFSGSADRSEMERKLAWCDVVVLQSSLGLDMISTVARLKQEGKAVVGDYDDLSFSVSPFNPAYKTLGLSDVKIMHDDKEGHLWKDGERGFSIKANYFRYKSLKDLLGMYNAVTTTGSYLKSRYIEYNPNTLILPNSINFELFKPFPREKSEKIRIGWTASDSHYSEIWIIKRVMRKILDKYRGKVKFVVLGNIYELQKEFSPKELERHDFIGLDTYHLKFASLNLDIGLSPLDKIKFNRAKSQLKWSEYASMKVPAVVSKLEPYACVEDGVTGMVADTEDEFYDKLCELIDNKELREKIAKNAYDKNYEDYNLAKNIPLWIDAFEQALDNYELPILEKGLLTKEK